MGYLGSACSLLHWDEETYMPPAALDYRADQASYISGELHRRSTSERYSDLLGQAEQMEFPEGSPEATNVREWRRSHDRNMKMPTELVEEWAKATTLARGAWAKSRETNDFKLFEPHLTKIIELNRRKADCIGYEDEPYDALLDAYEPGMRTAEVREVFAQLRKELTGLIPEAVELSKGLSEDQLQGEYDLENQKVFNQQVLRAFGFDFDAGRIDETTHPFCTTLGPRDVRLTTRYSRNDLMYSLYSVLHEAGHGMYEQGLPAEHYGTPAGSAVSLGIHESQSRLWENKVGRTLQFWQVWLERAQKLLPEFKRFDAETIAAAVNRVSPGYIRTESDEFTYDLHIILRFELELKLINGELEVKDLPGVWNSEFKTLLDLDVPDDTRGCLQDIHWSMGGFGYFSTYTLGNLISAMLFEKAGEEISSLDADLNSGNYEPLLKWLRENVHQHGMRYLAPDLVEKVTGKPLSIHAHINYLRDKLELMKG